MDFKTLVSQITTLYNHLTKKQKIVIALSTFIAIGFLVFLVLFTNAKKSDEEYAILFDNISAEDAALVIQQLELDGTKYKIVDEGTIKVPKDVVYKERIAIAALGIPKNSKVGFELFDKQNFAETDFEQRIKYLRALEGELSRTIESLDPIESAKVHIALPKESVFAQKATPPTASVILKIKPSMKLSSKQILGIKNLVSSSVAKLTSENVKIINQNGESLGEESQNGIEPELIRTQIRYKKEYEKMYEQKIENLLIPILGSRDKVVAKVTIDFDFKQQDTISEYYDPESVVRSEQSMEEKREGSAKQEIGGVPGAISNIAPVQGLDNNNNKTEKYSKSTTTTNYEISKKITNTKGEFATIKRVTAAVVVDGKYKNKIDENGNILDEKEYIALTSTELDAIESIVKRAIGYNEKRGDDVSVNNFEFNPFSVKKPKKPVELFVDTATSYINPFLPLFKYLLVGLLLFIFYKKIIVPFSEKMLQETKIEEEEIETKEQAIEEEGEDVDMIKKYQEAKRKIEEELGIEDRIDEDHLKYDVLLKKIKTIAEERPEDVANLIQSILKNEKDFMKNSG